ncbi:MAG: carbon-nitrogen hydrolase family protein [Ruminiclostridium sp.]|nr:carbon-nitrogen hydrolase family protein [Ruminiclostridium sp.]
MARIALFQMKNEGSMPANLEKSLNAVKEAAEGGASLILFPEVQLTEFFPQYSARDVSGYALELHSEVIGRFSRECRKYGIMAAPNIYLSEGGKHYDASVLIGRDGSIIGVQKMVHIAQAPQFCEQDYYTPADDGFKMFDTDIGKIGIVICFDRHYPESIRTEALKGAELILIPTANIITEPLEMFEWEIRVQAFQNSVAVAMCNRVGIEGEMEFSGQSVVIGADGDVIAKAGDKEQIVYAELDPHYSSELRKKKPYTDLRRTEFYR